MPTPRVTIPVRNQGEIQFMMPEDALPPEHPARVLWSVISRLDLSAFLADAGAFEGGSGRPTTSPRMLLTLWTYAISRGVGSAREIFDRDGVRVGVRIRSGAVAGERHQLAIQRVDERSGARSRAASRVPVPTSRTLTPTRFPS